MGRVLKQCLRRNIVILLMIVSIPLTISISSTIPVASSIFQNQEALAQDTSTLTRPVSSFLTYHNSTYGVIVQYPSDWIYKGSEDMPNANNNKISGQVQPIVTFAPQDKNIHTLVTIGTVNLPSVFKSIRIENMSSFASLVIDSIRHSTPGFQLIESSTTSVKTGRTTTTAAIADDRSLSNDGVASTSIPAQKIVYTAAGPVHNTMAVYALKGDKAYFISYLTETDSIYSSYFPIAQKMIDSFQIVNVNSKPATANISTKAPQNITAATTSNTKPKMITAPPTSNTPNISMQQHPKESRFLTYINSTYGIKIQFPSNWIYKGSETSNDSVQGIATFTSPDVLTSSSNKSLVVLTVGIEKLPYHNIPLDVYTNLTINNLRKSDAGFRLFASNEISLAGIKPAHKLIFTSHTMPNTMAVYGIKGDKAYVIDYIAGSEATYSNYLPLAQKMMSSFQIVNSTTSATQTNPNNNNTREKPAITLTPPTSYFTTSSNTGASNASSQKRIAELKAAQEQLLLAWDHTSFQDQLDTFVNSADGYGVYEEHKSNVFKPGEPIVLYVEPVGFTHIPISAGTGPTNNTKLYLINMTASIIVSDKQGNVLLGRENIPLLSVISHNKNTELFMNLRVTQSSPFPAGDYVVTYTVTDVPSGKNFKIVKDIVIAGGSSNSNSNNLAALPRESKGPRSPLSSPANQNHTSVSVTEAPCPYGLPRQLNGVCPIIPEIP
ncbi:MAG TPA: PsbP-related protein [Nitrososphaeraceae archaeon]|nr:PsbP-related protein [Nitrososphaeraceae archaeon]